MKPLTSLLLTLLYPIMLWGGEVELTGPTSPIEPRDTVQIFIKGIAAADLPSTAVTCSPSENVLMIPANTWGGQPFILFESRAKENVDYFITVSLNPWLAALNRDVAKAAQSSISKEDLAKLEALQIELNSKYPSGIGGCVVEVRTDDQSPIPPLPVQGPKRLIIIRESSLQTPQQSQLYASLHANNDLSSKKHQILILDPDQVDGNNLAPPEIAPYLKNANPASSVCFVVDIATNKTLFQGPTPEKEEEVLILFQKYSK